MAAGVVAGAWYLLCVLLIVWPLRRLPHYPQVSRAALLMSVPWFILVAALMGQPRQDQLTLDFIQAAVGLPLVIIVFWEYGLVFLLLPFTLVQYLATGEKLLTSGKWLCQQFQDYFRAEPRIAITFGTATYLPWLLWVFMAARVNG